jgi:inorganic triphosphatase YgiF
MRLQQTLKALLRLWVGCQARTEWQPTLQSDNPKLLITIATTPHPPQKLRICRSC